eukprot:7443522-Pyramimonas_sp.AAC.1
MCDKILNWEQQVNGQICMALRAGLIKKASLMAEDLLKSKRRKLEQKDSNTEEHERTVFMHGTKDFFNQLHNPDPFNEEIAKWASKLSDSLQDVDKGAKMSMVSGAIAARTPALAEHAQRL